jgi:hypothetical protein
MFKKSLCVYLAFCMFLIAIAPRVEGALSPSAVVGVQMDRAADLAKVRAFLEEKKVRQRLEDLGFSAEEISSKLATMGDAQLHSFAQRLDDLKVGGDGVGLIIGVLIILILVVILLNLMGRKVVVTK